MNKELLKYSKKYLSLSKSFLFRYKNKKETIDINDLIFLLQFNHDNKVNSEMILDVITSNKSNEGKTGPLEYTPLVIDFDTKDDETRNMIESIGIENVIEDVKTIIKKILKKEFDFYYDNNDNDCFDKDLFNYLHFLCDFNINNNNKINDYEKNFNNFTTAIIQRKYMSINFHIIYPFVIINHKYIKRFYSRMREELTKKKQYKNFKFDEIDNHLDVNCLRVINCNKKDKINDEYFIDVKTSDVNDVFLNTEWDNFKDEQINKIVFIHNIFLCSLQWSRCGLINDYSFEVKDEYVDYYCVKKNEKKNEEKKKEEKKNTMKNKMKKIIESDEKKDEQMEHEQTNEQTETDDEICIESTIYSITDILFILDNFKDDYWKKQSYGEWRDDIWSCHYFSYVLNDEKNVIYDKIYEKSKMYDGFKDKEFNDIWYKYDMDKNNKIRGKLVSHFKHLCLDKYNERFAVKYDKWKDDDEEEVIEVVKIPFNYKDKFNAEKMKKYGKNGDIKEMVSHFTNTYIRTSDSNDSEWFKLSRYIDECKVVVNGITKKIPIDNMIVETKKFVDTKYYVYTKDEKGKTIKHNFLDYGSDLFIKFNELPAYDASSIYKPVMYYEIVRNKRTGETIKNYYLNKNEISLLLQTNKVLNVKKYDIDKTQKGFDTIINYLKNVVCLSTIRNNETGINEINEKEQNDKYIFLMSWIKRIFNLEKNNTCIIFCGKPGTGKTSLFYMLSKIMIGLSLQDNKGDIYFSNFNAKYKNKFIVSLEELEECDRHNKCDLKNLITSQILSLNEKYEKMITNYPNYASIMITTNDITNLIKGLFESAELGDRRYSIFKLENEDVIGNNEYWNEFYDTLEDIEVLKRFYDYVKNNDEFNYPNNMYLETIEKKQLIKDNKLDVYELFVKDLFLMCKYLISHDNKVVKYEDKEIINTDIKYANHNNIIIKLSQIKKLFKDYVFEKKLDEKLNNRKLVNTLECIFKTHYVKYLNADTVILKDIDEFEEILINKNIYENGEYDNDDNNYVFCDLDY